MKKSKGVFIYILMALFIIMGCSNQAAANEDSAQVEELQEQIKVKEEKIAKLEEKNNNYETDNKYLKEELDIHKNLIDKAISYLNEDELLELAEGEWKYKIEVNGQPISSDGEIEINKKEVEITYSESVSSTILPEKISENGRISGEYLDHLTFVDAQPKEIKRLDGTVVTAFVYVFENLSENTSIQIKVSDELKERLELKTNLIRIHVK